MRTTSFGSRVLLAALAALLLFPSGVRGQTWSRTLERTGAAAAESIACCVRSVAGSGFVVAGQVFSSPSTSFVARLDDHGEVVWQKRYTATGVLAFRSLATTSDGGFLVGAFATDGLTFLKLDASGNVSWATQLGDDGPLISNDANDVAEAADGTYLVSGTTFEPSTNLERAWVGKLTTLGAVSWQNLYHETFASSASTTEAMEPTPDGGAIVAGTVDCGATSFTCGILLKLRPNGLVDWAKTYDYPTGDRDRLMAVDIAGDGGFFAVGRSVTSGTTSFVQRTDDEGVLAWARNMPLAPDWPYGVAAATDGGVLVPNATGNNQWSPAVLLKFDAAGALSWQRGLGACGSHPVYDMDLAPNGFVFAGEASFREMQVSPTDAWVLRTASDGTTEGTCPYEAAGSITPGPVTPAVSNGNVQRSNGGLPAGSLSVTVVDETLRAFEACGTSVTTRYPEVSPPGAAIPLLFPDSGTLTWDPGPAGLWDSYNVYRAVDDPVDGHACLASVDALVGASLPVPEAPPPGGLFSYLVSGVNAEGESPLGRQSLVTPPFRPGNRCAVERRALTYCP